MAEYEFMARTIKISKSSTGITIPKTIANLLKTNVVKVRITEVDEHALQTKNNG